MKKSTSKQYDWQKSLCYGRKKLSDREENNVTETDTKYAAILFFDSDEGMNRH